MAFLKEMQTQSGIGAFRGLCCNPGNMVVKHRVLLMIFFLWLIVSPITAYSQTSLATSGLRVTDVTPTAFSLVWTSNQPASCSAFVYSDPEGIYQISGLNITDESAEHPPAGKNGVMKVRVSGLDPGTTYYFKIVTVSDTGVLVEPSIGELPSVTTELETGIPNNDVLLHRVLKSDGSTPALGALLLVEVAGGGSPVTGWVGEYNPGPPWAQVNLNNLYSASTHSSLELSGGEAVTVESLGGSMGFRRLSATVPEETGRMQTLSPEPDDEECTLLIYLPATWEYGAISGDPSQKNGVSFHFEGTPGTVVLTYEVYDIDSETEVEISINGVSVGFAPVTGDNTWGGLKTITLPDAHVNDASANVITFRNTYNPGANEMWGVRSLSYDLKRKPVRPRGLRIGN